jgi:putative phosphoesterase
MKLLILSDIHGNLDALDAICDPHDELWVLGDIVNYGPQPRETLESVKATASVVVQGNHDYAVGHCDDSRWSARFREVAEATRRFTSGQLSGLQKAWLRSLPVNARVEREGVRFYLTHATPSDPHYGNIEADSDDWVAELEGIDADVLLVGHSHVPFLRRIGRKVVVNPGSVGQPRSGDARASYALWDDGEFILRRAHYPVETTIAKLKLLGFTERVEQELVATLRTGGSEST